MKEELINYCCKKVMEDLRESQVLSEELLKIFNRYPLIETLRILVEEQDIPMLKQLGAIVKCGVWRIKRPPVFDLHFV